MTIGEEIPFDALEASDRLSRETAGLRELAGDWERLGLHALPHGLADPTGKLGFEPGGALRELLELRAGAVERRLRLRRIVSLVGLGEATHGPLDCPFVHGVRG